MVLLPLMALLLAAGTHGAARADEAADATDMASARHTAVVRVLTGRFRVPADNAERIVAAVEQAAAKLKLPASLILAIIQTESSFDAHATSSAGALGLMQVMPATRRDVVPSGPVPGDIFEPSRNIYVGTAILRRYLDQTGGNMDRALYRYSGGTRGYAQRVTARWRFFSDFGEPGPRAPVVVESVASEAQ